MGKFARLSWSLVPGPVRLSEPVVPSDQVHGEIARYAPAEVAAVLTGLPEVSVRSSGNGDWWGWSATYEGAHDLFDINMTVFETEPPIWGGCELEGATDPLEALSFWRKVDTILPGCYLHSSEARLYSLEAFVQAFVVGGDSNSRL